jgi:hypothetical protein
MSVDAITVECLDAMLDLPRHRDPHEWTFFVPLWALLKAEEYSGDALGFIANSLAGGAPMPNRIWCTDGGFCYWNRGQHDVC